MFCIAVTKLNLLRGMFPFSFLPEAWNCILCYLEYYRDSITKEIEALVGDKNGYYSYGDRHIKEVAVKAGLQTAFKVSCARMVLY